MGIRDAANLAWRLSLVTKGLANSDLIKDYSSERREPCKFLIVRWRAWPLTKLTYVLTNILSSVAMCYRTLGSGSKSGYHHLRGHSRGSRRKACKIPQYKSVIAQAQIATRLTLL